MAGRTFGAKLTLMTVLALVTCAANKCLLTWRQKKIVKTTCALFSVKRARQPIVSALR